MAEPKRVLITGAAGNIGYSLAPLVASGAMLGPNQPVILHLLEIQQAQKALDALVMELEDCAYPLLAGVVPTVDPKVAFTDIDYALFVGAFPRREGMERKDLIEKNANIFSSQGKILDEVAKKTVKVVVVGNPANTNCLVLMKNAPSISPRNFTALTRLDHNRAKSQVAIKASVPVTAVKNVVIWGNHSSTQYPDVNHGSINGKPVLEVLSEHKDYLHGEFISTVQQRGAAVIKARGLSSALSAANAIVDHMRDWVLGSDQYVSMGVISDGSYGIEPGLIFSFPLTVRDGDYTIVKDLQIDEFSQAKLNATKEELVQERDIALEIVGLKN